MAFRAIVRSMRLQGDAMGYSSDSPMNEIMSTVRAGKTIQLVSARGPRVIIMAMGVRRRRHDMHADDRPELEGLAMI